MSCDWTIKCVDCNEVPEEIWDANHQMPAMQFLVANAKTLRDLYLLATKDGNPYEIEMKVNYRISVPFRFLVQHADHRLRPFNEYGEFDTPCKAEFWCHLCNAIVTCSDLEHPERKVHNHVVDHIGHREQTNGET